jgi:hypothetical protein
MGIGLSGHYWGIGHLICIGNLTRKDLGFDSFSEVKRIKKFWKLKKFFFFQSICCNQTGPCCTKLFSFFGPEKRRSKKGDLSKVESYQSSNRTAMTFQSFVRWNGEKGVSRIRTNKEKNTGSVFGRVHKKANTLPRSQRPLQSAMRCRPSRQTRRWTRRK